MNPKFAMRVWFVLSCTVSVNPSTWAQNASPAGQQQLLNNPGFEGAYHQAVGTGDVLRHKAKITGQIADGWADNSGWADVSAEYAQDTANAHGGNVAQRIEVQGIRGGAVQFVQSVKLQKGHVYRARVWLRSDSPTVVDVVLRQSGAPYKAYCDEGTLVTQEWSEIDVVGTATDDTAGYFMIDPSGVGTYWVDDASLEDLTDAASSAPIKTGNLLPDGSFEAGMGGGWSVRVRGGGPRTISARQEYADPRYVIDTTTASDGNHSLKIVIPAQCAAIVNSPLVGFNFGRAHTASVALKADRDGVGVDLTVPGTSLKNSVRVGTEWKRYRLSGVLPYADYTRLSISCWPHDDRATTLWIDGASLQEGAVEAPIYQAAFPVEMTLTVPRPGAVFFDGETARVGVVTNGPVQGAHLDLQLTDLYGKSIALPAVDLPVQSVTVAPDPVHPRGMFKLRAQVLGPDGQVLSAPVLQIFSRLPRPRDIAPDQSFFGVHIPLTPEYIAIARAIGARWARVHDASIITKWTVVEPQPGQWQFLDEGAQAARKAGMQVLGMLDDAPGWTSSKQGPQTFYRPDGPQAASRWTEYVTETVSHYRGTIDYWEVWNEPYNNFFPGTPQQYGELLKLAYPAAKAANPSVTVVGIDTALSKPDFTRGALSVAGPQYFDALSFHDYDSSLYGGPNNPAVQTAEALRQAEARFGDVKPLWDTEGGAGALASWYLPNSKGMPARVQVAHAIRFDVTQLAVGVKHFFYYTLHADPAFGSDGNFALEHDRSIRPLLAARAVLASLIDGVPFLGHSEPVPGVDAFAFGPDKGSTVTVLWSYRGAAKQVPVPVGARVLDGLGNTVPAKKTIEVGYEPIYFLQ